MYMSSLSYGICNKIKHRMPGILKTFFFVRMFGEANVDTNMVAHANVKHIYLIFSFSERSSLSYLLYAKSISDPISKYIFPWFLFSRKCLANCLPDGLSMTNAVVISLIVCAFMLHVRIWN